MNQLLKFIIIFFCILAMDIICLNVDGWYFVRYFSKPAIILSLGIYFFLNSKHLFKQQRYFMLAAIVSYAIGDIIFLDYDTDLMFMIGFVFFFIANMLYTLVFQFRAEYRILSVAIFSIVILAYVFYLLKILTPHLGGFFYPIIAFMVVMFSSMQSAYFRINQVSKKSFYLVFLGIVLYVITQSLIAYSRFVGPWPYENLLTMALYGISHLAVVIGLTYEPDMIDDLSPSNRKTDFSSKFNSN